MIVLLGRFSADFAATFEALAPPLAARIHATGTLLPDHLSSYLAACDLMVQPYPDGVSARRTTLIAALAHGRPVLTTSGPATEAWWADVGAVAMVRDDAAELARGIGELLSDPERRSRYGVTAAALYRSHFSLAGTIGALRAAACASQ
jgi:glycosyltransferase involved in cell wall biosynthesis